MLTGDKRPTWTVYCHLPINLSPPLHLAFIPKIGDRLKTLNFQTVDSMIFFVRVQDTVLGLKDF